MATEVRRLAPSYFVQTPNDWFPLEPHFLVPGWQWFPRTIRVWAVARWKVGHCGPFDTRAEAWEAVEEIRLLDKRQLKEPFPDGRFATERIGPLVSPGRSIDLDALGETSG